MSNVSIYDAFFHHDAWADWGSMGMLICNSSYTYDASHALSDVTGYELTDTGYARVTGLTLQNPAVATPPSRESDYWFEPSPPTTFAAITTADWRYVVFYDAVSSDLYFCVDNGAAAALANETLDLSGSVFVMTG